ncbi:MAG: carbohydrate-binding cenc domain protein [Paenibacillaceae bacterium]|nr:carbohydrate-binding cenc domain protein [Paenibacillaceae bacterium]
MKRAGLRAAGILLVVLAVLFGNVEQAAANQNGSVYYVSDAEGNDATGDGSFQHPWKTIQKAAQVLEAGDICYIREGVYRETVVPAHSGTAGAKIKYAGYNSETVVVSGTDTVVGWTYEEAHLYAAPVELNLGAGNQVFADGGLLTEARWPNNTGDLLTQTYAVMSQGSAATITSSELPAGLDPTGAQVWFRGGAGWAGLDSEITAYDPVSHTMTMKPVGSTGTYYDARAGNSFYLWGKKAFLDAEGEWWYDGVAKKLYIRVADGEAPGQVEVKTRELSWDLSGKEHIEISGIQTRGNTILTDEGSNHLLMKDMKMEYISHRTRTPKQDGRPEDLYRGIQLKGWNNEINSSELAYSSSGLVMVNGQGNTIVNSYLHDGNYAGTWGGLVTIAGEGHYIGYNTMTRAGRDVINMSGLGKNIIEHNDLSFGAMICYDTAMIYSPNTDGRGTEIRYNKIHDMNPAAHLGMGIYLDNSTSNFVIHHNVLWNIANSDPIRLNSPSNYNLVYNNTLATNTRRLTTAGGRFGEDMFGNRLFNNIIYDSIHYPVSEGVTYGNNIYILQGQNPQFIDAGQLDFRIGPGSPAIDAGMVIPGITDGYAGLAPDVGAYEAGSADFRTGHDFQSAPPLPNRSLNHIPYANQVVNYGFETMELTPWTANHPSIQVHYAGSAAWTSETADSRFQKASMKLTGEGDEIRQVVAGLQPGTRYTFSVWSKVSDDSAAAEFGVRDYGGAAVTGSSSTTGWTQSIIDFTTGPSQTSAAVFLRKTQGAAPNPGNLHHLGQQAIADYTLPVQYDVTAFIEEQLLAAQPAATLLLKVDKPSPAKRITFGSRENGVESRRPRLLLSYTNGGSGVLTAMEDANVKSSSGSEHTNNGSASTLNASYWNDQYVENLYLKFDLSAIAGELQEVRLQLQPISASGGASVSTKLFGLADNSWQESTLTWVNRPAETEPMEGAVFFDDAGVILPLGYSTTEDQLRHMLLTAQGLAAHYSGNELVDEAIVADLENEAAGAVALLQSNAAEPELEAALLALEEKVDAFYSRLNLAVLITDVQEVHSGAREGELQGQYMTGAKAELQTALNQAVDIVNAISSGPALIRQEEQDLQAALALFESKVILHEIGTLERADMALMLAQPAQWSTSYSTNNGYALFTGAVSKYNGIIGNQVFTMDVNYQFIGNGDWPGIVLRSQHPTLPVLGSGDTSYFIIFKQDTWELQKRINGTQVWLKSYPNTPMESGVDVRLDAGAIDVFDGVRIFVYADGERVFDIIDRNSPISAGYMGIVPQGSKSDGIRVRAVESQD